MSTLAKWLGLVTRTEMSGALAALRTELEQKIMSSAEQTEAAANEKFAALLGTVVAEIKSLRANVESFPAQLAQAVADGDKARADALAADALADAARLDAYSDTLAELYPATVPVVEVPDAGQPATPPADADVEVPEVETPVVDIPVVETPAGDGEAPAAGGDEVAPAAGDDTTTA